MKEPISYMVEHQLQSLYQNRNGQFPGKIPDILAW